MIKKSTVIIIVSTQKNEGDPTEIFNILSGMENVIKNEFLTPSKQPPERTQYV